MRYSVKTIQRDFTPSEAARITGVSTALQRDWRRRGILSENSEGKWTRWTLDDIIQLSVRKIFADAGLDVSQTRTVARMAILPTAWAISCIPEANEFEGDEIPDETKEKVRMRSIVPADPSHQIGRFLVSFGPSEYDFFRTDNLSDVQNLLDAEPQPVAFIVDCENLALRIFQRANGPLVRFEVENTVAAKND